MHAPPPLEIVAHESAHGRWMLARRRPALQLRHWLIGYQGYLETGGRPVRRRELPVTVIPLVLNLGPPFLACEGGRAKPLPAAFTAGLWQAPAVVGSTGTAHCLQVDMTPLAARALLGVPMAELTDRIADLDDLSRGWAPELLDRLAGIADWPARFDLLDATFTARLAASPPASPLVARALARLPLRPVRAIAQELDTSRTRLHRLFLDQVGLPPRTVGRLLRFERAMDRLRDGWPLAEVAAASGYYDQPHFNREVQSFAGETPTALRRRMLADGTGVLDGPA
ncbi:MAG: helix-turn-helix domain-containing protein [Geminicoccaceae bacterium]